MSQVLPISALVATRDRSVVFTRMLKSLAQQSAQPAEMIVVDGSENDKTEQLCQSNIAQLNTKIIYQRAIELGAAIQRNQAIQSATHSTVLFLDDDIILKSNCIGLLWEALKSNPSLGGVNSMIINQQYLPPGRIGRIVFSILNGRREDSYAGKCIGPACNLLPEDGSNLPEVVSVEWLNTTCTLYRRKALPTPPFPSHFYGASLSEDLTLSLIVSKKWQLANVRTARIFHDSQPGEHKKNVSLLSQMELVNRHYVMTKILERRRIIDYLKLLLFELYQVAGCAICHKNWRSLTKLLEGKLAGIKEIICSNYILSIRQK